MTAKRSLTRASVAGPMITAWARHHTGIRRKPDPFGTEISAQSVQPPGLDKAGQDPLLGALPAHRRAPGRPGHAGQGGAVRLYDNGELVKTHP